MNKKLNGLDKKCLELVIDISKKTYKAGNFPVGAVLVIDNKIIDAAGNERRKQRSWAAHAENSLIIKNGEAILRARKQNKIVKLYSALEPCIQCLGASVINRVNQIFFIQKDPIGGACDLGHNNISPWYKEIWPKIYYCPMSDEPKKLLIEFFHNEIRNENATKWYKKCYNYYYNKN
jgi:tRNA(adenine34) deaminase